MTPLETFWNHNNEQSRREYLKDWGIRSKLHHMISRVPFKMLSEEEKKVIGKALDKALNS